MLDNILCVEDDYISQMLMKRVLSKSSFAREIHIVSNGYEALEFYKNLLDLDDTLSYPSLVLLDLNMPIINGWEFLDEFINTYLPHFEDTKVAILTSSIDHEDRQKAKGYSIVTDFISKPLTVDMLKKLKGR
ncbi:MAG: response regulator [Balneolales bacterium]